MALLNEINVKGVPHPIVTDDGYYQEMTVGDAEQLVATTFTEDDAPYNFRTAGGAIDIGDRKQVEGLVGGTVAWNQRVKNGNFADGGTSWSAGSNASFTVSDGTLTATANGTPAGNQFVAQGAMGITDGNIVLWKAKLASNNEQLVIQLTQTSPWKLIKQQTVSVTSTLTEKGGVVKCEGGNPNQFILNFDQKENMIVQNVQVFNLTQMFGSTIAEYILSLEQSQAGAGVAYFKKLFPKSYYAYNAGQLMSVKALRHKTVGFNNVIDYENKGSTSQWSSPLHAKLQKFIIGATYCLSFDITGVTQPINLYLNERYDVIYTSETISSNGRYVWTFVADKNANDYAGQMQPLLKFASANNPQVTFSNVCLNLSWDGERDGEYEEYSEHVYELDPDLELRGIPKLSAGNDLYYDGDVYEPDGTVTRKYGIVDLGTLTYTKAGAYHDGEYKFQANLVGIKPNSAVNNVEPVMCSKYAALKPNDTYLGDTGISVETSTYGYIGIHDSSMDSKTAEEFKSAMSGVYLVYELATPTEDTADPYQGVQIVNDFGTEEFVDAGVAAGTRDVAIPVGHNSLYQPNLRAKLEMVPEAPEDEGYYVVYHHDGINEYVPLIIPQELPNLPSEDGTYTLKCTVASGSATLSFESEV